MKEMSKNETNTLKATGLKVTGPRIKILKLFQEAALNDGVRHLCAEEVYQELLSQDEDIALATVYRVLSQFESAGILSRNYFHADKATYELLESTHHDHVVCLGCGKVVEFVDRDIEEAQKVIAERLGFELQDHSMVLYGLCENCRKTSPKE